jgi:hypothetical protein
MTANATTSPDGNSTAEQWAGDGTNAIHDFYQAFTGGSTTTSTIYVKKNTAQFVYISLNHQGTGTDWATGVYDLDNLTTATFQSGGVTNQVATITDEGNGWRRITLSVSTTDTALYCMYGIANSLSPSFGANRGRVVFSTSASFYTWGAQLEAGTYATSYIPTTSASVTRNADVISKTGISSLIGQTEGTLFVDVYRPNQASPFLFTLANSVGSNSYLNSIYIFQLPNDKMVVDCFVSGVKQFGIETSVGITNGRHKIAVAYKQNDAVVYLDGVLLGTDTSCNIPPFSAFEVNNVDIGSTSNFDINSVALWKTKLDNATLAQLTTI